MNSGRRASLNHYRFLLYSHNTIGLGHFRRCLLIGQALSKHFDASPVLILTGCSTAYLFDAPYGVDYVKVPSLRSAGGFHPSYVPENIDLPASTVFKLRSSIYQETLREYHPHLFLVDHSPMGLAMELRDAVKISKELQVKLVVGFRDILGDPQVIKKRWEKRGIRKVFDVYYDAILVYGSPFFYDFVGNYNLESLEEKIHYCGLIVNKNFKVNKSIEPAPKLLVTVGSGRDGSKLVRKFFNSCRYLEKRIDFKAKVILGPLMPQKTREEFLGRSRKFSNVEIEFFSSMIESEIANSAVVILMAGYNTVAQVLYQKKPMILLPRKSADKEQFLRATILGELGLATILNEKSTAKEFASVIENVLSSNRPKQTKLKISFDGIKNVTRICQSALTKTS